jgi:hypothetical protein
MQSRHDHVEHDEVRSKAPGPLQGSRGVRFRLDLVALVLEHESTHLEERLLIVDHEDACHQLSPIIRSMQQPGQVQPEVTAVLALRLGMARRHRGGRCGP